MIHSITSKNFYSFKDEMTINFKVNDHAPSNDAYAVTSLGTKLSKVQAVVGPNAAGKTNLLKALPFLRWLIVDSFTANPKDPLHIHTCVSEQSEVAELSVIFEIEKRIYYYDFKVSRDRIIYEALKYSSLASKNMSHKKLFVRNWNNQLESYDFKASANFNLPKGIETKSLLRTNASVISAAMRFSHEESELIGDYWSYLTTNVSESGWVGADKYRSLIARAMSLYADDPEIKQEAIKILSRFDLGIKNFRIDTTQDIDGTKYEAIFDHEIGGKNVELEFRYESAGTQQLFLLLCYILLGLDLGGMVVLDEFDANLHPLITAELIQLFTDQYTNPNNAQILFATHNTVVLNKLDKYQIYLVEKDEDGFSEGWRLDEIDGVRLDDNYASKYLSGAYGATPKI